MKLYFAAILVCALVWGVLSAAEESTLLHPTIQLVPVETGVKLEVVDWGGKGPTVVMLAALGADAHEFDNFAPQLTGKYHVIGITRRGFGASSKPAVGYSNERLGKDVIAVLDALKIRGAVFIGHSMAGMELSWIGTHDPKRVYGLVYVEAAYAYAFYSDSSHDPENLQIDSLELRKRLLQLLPGGGRPDQQRLTAELIAEVGRFERELRDHAEMIKDYPDPPIDPANPPHPPAWLTGIYQGLEKYTRIEVPALAIFAMPHALGDLGNSDELAKNPGTAAKLEALDLQRTGSQAAAFERGVPGSRVVRIPHASHFIFGSNEKDVLREVSSFLDQLSSSAIRR
jgi:pimeloyl-ACP methyl ester carboxylesterase